MQIHGVSTRKRAVLTADIACTVFLMKNSFAGVDEGRNVSSLLVARKFGVSPKTIRDIWNGSVTCCKFSVSHTSCIYTFLHLKYSFAFQAYMEACDSVVLVSKSSSAIKVVRLGPESCSVYMEDRLHARLS